MEDTSADSILVKWEDIPVEELRGFLRGYVFYFEKGERDTSKMRGLESGKFITNVTAVLPRSSSFTTNNGGRKELLLALMLVPKTL